MASTDTSSLSVTGVGGEEGGILSPVVTVEVVQNMGNPSQSWSRSVASSGRVSLSQYYQREPGPSLDGTNSSQDSDESIDDDDLLHVHVDNHGFKSSMSECQTIMNIMKSSIGTGILALPSALSHGGLFMGTVILILIGWLALHNMLLLLKSHNLLCERLNLAHLGYAELMETAMEHSGLGYLARHKIWGRRAVNFFLLFTQFGFTCVYIVFIATNVQETVQAFTDQGPSLIVYEAVTIIFLAPFCLIRELRTLTPFAQFANVAVIFGLGLIVYDVCQDLSSWSSLSKVSPSVTDLSLFFGTVFYAFEGISLVLPLHNSIRDKRRYPSVLALCMNITVIVNAIIAFLGYCRYGESIKGSITLNMPTHVWYLLSVKPLFAVSIFISYNIQLFVPVAIIKPFIYRKLSYCTATESRRVVAEYILRVVCVLATGAIAISIPMLDLLISVIGASASSFLALILPAVISSLVICGTTDDRVKCRHWTHTTNALSVLIGLIGCLVGTYSAVLAIVRAA